MNAPKAGDNPTNDMSVAMPTTNASVNTINISCTWRLLMKRNTKGTI